MGVNQIDENETQMAVVRPAGDDISTFGHAAVHCIKEVGTNK